MFAVVSVCMFICLSVITLTPEPLEISPQNFQGIMVERTDQFEKGNIGVHGGDLMSLTL